MSEEPLQLLLDLDTPSTRKRWNESVTLSVIFHTAIVITLMLEPNLFGGLAKTPPQAPKKPREQITFLASPPEDFKPQPLEQIRPHPPVVVPRDQIAMSKPVAPDLPPAPPPLPPQTKQQVAQSPTPAPPQTQQQLPSGPTELKLSDVPLDAPKLPQSPTQASAGKSLEDSIRSLARQHAAGGADVTLDPGLVRVDPRNPGAIGGAKIMSDTQGVDFSAYLQRLLYDIRRNWLAILPEIARMGKRGRVILQFEVNKDGTVPRIYLTGASGSDPLDRAALAGISGSSPMPPLPAEFKGQMVRLEVTFLYNMSAEGR